MSLPHSSEELMRSFDEQIRNATRQAEQIRTAARETKIRQASNDGTLAVTVASNGDVVALEIKDAAMRKQASELSHSIMTTLRAAQSQLAARMQEALAPVLGDETGAMEAVINGYHERFPAPEEPSAQLREATPAEEEEPESWLDQGGRS